MHPLDIPIARLRDAPITLDVDLPPESLDLNDPEFEFRGPVTGQVTFHRAGQGVFAAGALEVQVGATCGRCLAPAVLALRADVKEAWMPQDPEAEARPDDEEAEEEEVHFYRDEIVEPAEVFRELLMAELPDNPVCKPDCRGLCPGCGANLNLEPCRCGPAAEPSPTLEPTTEPALPEWKRKLKDIHL